MEKEFIPYKEALALKELGFNEPCHGLYYSNMELVYSHVTNKGKMLFQLNESWIANECTAPLYQQAFRWFRDKALDSYINMEHSGLYFSFIWNGVVWEQSGEGSYEEAQLACLRKLIEIVRNE